MFSGSSYLMGLVVMQIDQTGQGKLKMAASKLQLWPLDKLFLLVFYLLSQCRPVINRSRMIMLSKPMLLMFKWNGCVFFADSVPPPN